MAAQTSAERLADIVQSIVRIERFLAGKSYADFSGDALIHDAVVRNLEIISEASRHLSDDIQQRAPEVPWRKVADMGNWIRHAYEKVEDRILWDTIQEGLPVLAAAVRRLRQESL
jgi:uncharacterized protein with HEPN domain